MREPLKWLALAGLICGASPALGHEPHVCPDWLPDAPALPGHVHQADVDAGFYSFEDLSAIGRELFTAAFNTCDGQGRPATTGTGDPRDPSWPRFMRTAAPDANSCTDCHSLPRQAGAGGFVTNAFVMVDGDDPNTLSTTAKQSNERNPPSLFGVGPIELLAREMTVDLRSQAASLPDGEHVLKSKGVVFPVVKAGGQVVESTGVDTDLIVKPFMQSGIVRSIREFAAGAFNQHFGMQPAERFDLHPDRGPDADDDGVADELSVGDITALVVFLAGLPVPDQVLPDDHDDRRRISHGEALFATLGCAACHVPAMRLESTRFSEPYALNPVGTLNDASHPFVFDLTVGPERPRLRRTGPRGAMVRAYTDLKRHNMCDPEDEPGAIRYFCNEQLDQGRPTQDGRPGREFFITKDLWDVGSTAPYGHRGDLTTIAEVVLVHGGEAREARDAFVAKSVADQRDVIAFLKTLQVVAEESSRDGGYGRGWSGGHWKRYGNERFSYGGRNYSGPRGSLAGWDGRFGRGRR